MNNKSAEEVVREQQYRDLGPDEVIQEGDEFRLKCDGDGEWRLCHASIGTYVGDHSYTDFRRPVGTPGAITNSALKQRIAELERENALA